ncbi:MAG: ABC transporter permease, partial [Anaerolineae bacterium]
VFASFVLDRAQVELAVLSARGASVWQITRLFAVQHLILALAAGLLLGPALAQAAIYLWSRGTGGFLPGTLPGRAWLFSAITAGFGWLALVLPVFLSARRSVRHRGTLPARPPQQSPIQKRYLDLYLLAFAGLLYWQLNQSGSFLMRQLGDTQVADPLLLLGPTLLLVAAAVVFLRIVPLVLRLVAWPCQHLRGWALSLGLLHLARAPRRAGRLVLLVTLTAGLLLFSRTYGGALAHSQDALAQGVGRAMEMNTLALLLFSLLAFFLANLLAARERQPEFAVLRSLGIPPRRAAALLVLEGTVVLVLGLLAGNLAGWGLARIMIPYLSQSLAVEPVVTDWTAVVGLHALLLAAYGLALALGWLIEWRSQSLWVQSLGDE